MDNTQTTTSTIKTIMTQKLLIIITCMMIMMMSMMINEFVMSVDVDCRYFDNVKVNKNDE